MSVINQMLRELEQRDPSRTQPKLIATDSGKPGKTTGWLIGLLTLLVLTGGYFGLNFQQNQTSADSTQPPPISAGSAGLPEQIQTMALAMDTKTSEPEQSTLSAPEDAAPKSELLEVKYQDLTQAARESALPEVLTSEPISQSTEQVASPEVTLFPPSEQTLTPPVRIAVVNQEKIQIQGSQKSATKKLDDSGSIKSQSRQTLLNQRFSQIIENTDFSMQKQALDRLLIDAPDFHQARLWLLNACWKNQHPQTAQLMQQAGEKYPQVAAYSVLAAQYFLEQGQLELGDTLLSSSLRVKPDHDALKTRALIRQKQGRHQEAISDYSQILMQSGNKAEIYLAIAISLESIGNRSQALLSYQQSLQYQQLSMPQRAFVEAKIAHFQG